MIAAELDMEPYAAVRVAGVLRQELVRQGEIFVFETVFSDAAGEKLAFLKDAVDQNYTVVVCFIGISGAEISEERVAMRVSQRGPDVPTEKLITRFPRTFSNLKSAIQDLPHVKLFDNDDLRSPFRKIAVIAHGQQIHLEKPVSEWLRRIL